MKRVSLFFLFIISNLVIGSAQVLTEQSAAVGINHSFRDDLLMGGGAAFFDYDMDGDEDVYITGGYNKDDLYRNNGNGTFTKVSNDVGIDITFQYNTMGVTTGDIDNDGDRDIFVTTWKHFTGIEEVDGRSLLFLNNGNGTFTEIGQQAGIADMGCTIAAVPSDYDMDGDLDLYLANDFGYFLVPNVMYENNYPENSFTDVSAETGADVEAYGMGIASGDYDHDLDFDYYTTNIGRNILCENLGSNGFADVTTNAGVENATVPTESNLNTTGWGTAFFDVDNDTWEDLFVANGRIPALPAYATALHDPDKLYMNNGDKTFTDVTDEVGVDIGDDLYTHGMAYSDYDEDGDLDIITVVLDDLDGYSKFYVNETNNGNNYIQFKLIGVESNRDAYGSKAWVYAGDLTLVKEIYGGGASHASQHTSVLHFGLADIEQVDSVKIQWTNGHVDVLENPEVNMRHTVVEGGVVNINEPAINELGVTVAPNPFNSQLNIYIDKPSNIGKAVSIRLSNVSGVLILQKTMESARQLQLDMDQSLPAGMYLLEVRSEEGRSVKKLIKK